MSGGLSASYDLRTQDVFYVQADYTKRRRRGQTSGSIQSYRVKCGYEPIPLDGVEFRILKFLSSKPYHAFTPGRIAKEVSTDQLPVTEETLRDHIHSLRMKLGFFSDYVQTVPYIGYRFKE